MRWLAKFIVKKVNVAGGITAERSATSTFLCASDVDPRVDLDASLKENSPRNESRINVSRTAKDC